MQNGLLLPIKKEKSKNSSAFNSIAISSNDNSSNLGSSQYLNASMNDFKRKNSTFYYSHMFKEYDPVKFEQVNKNKFLLSNSLSKFLNFWNESSLIATIFTDHLNPFYRNTQIYQQKCI